MRALVVALACAVAGVAHADPLLTKAEIAQGAKQIEACLAKEAEGAKCIGLVSGPCDDAISAGGAAAHATCADNETAAWDVVLNARWKTLSTALDAETFAALKGVQKAWLAYRDAKCNFARTLDDSIMGYMEAAQCRMQETARRTVELGDLIGR